MIPQQWLSRPFPPPTALPLEKAMLLQDIFAQTIASGVGDDHEGRGVV
jgi:hypothetical protein